jgi:dihydroorotase
MSKFLCLGLPLADTVRAAADAPAKALRRGDLGTLQPGAAGDASVLELETGDFDYVDSTGERLAGPTRLSARAVVMNGKWRKAEPVLFSPRL